MNGKPATLDGEAAELLATWRQAERNTTAARDAEARHQGVGDAVETAEAAEAVAKAAYHAAQDRLFSDPDVATEGSVATQAGARRLV